MRDLDHRAQPGPGYWDWRCLRCGEDCDRHPTWLHLIGRKIGRWLELLAYGRN